MIGQDIAIVGGTGEFGQHLGKLLEENNNLRISGKNVEEAKKIAEEHGWNYGNNEEIVEGADVVIIAVPISVTVEVVNQIGDSISEETLFCDITSIKQKPVEAMKQYSEQVLGMHPMYAPSNSVKGQKVVLTPEIGKKWTEMEEFWKRNGADIHITTPEEHDKAMSLVQGLMHFSELVVAETIRKSDFSGEEMDEYSSPVYKLITDLTARMLNQKPALYESIQVENQENQEIRNQFIESAEEIDQIINQGNLSEKFLELGKQFNMEKSQERTDRVIEFLSESDL